MFLGLVNRRKNNKLKIIFNKFMKEESKKIIKEETVNLINLMGFSVEISIIEDENDENRVICNISSDSDANFLIGQNGENLQAIQHLIRLLVRKKTDDMVKFLIDVNSYRKDQESSILSLAKEAAEEAINNKKTVVLKPMSAYNRRLVHMFLANNKDVVTESSGDESERRVIVKPV